jgi:hypothetical protein
MAQPYPLTKPQPDQSAAETDVLLKLLAIGEEEIKNGRFRSAEIVFQELETISGSSIV